MFDNFQCGVGVEGFDPSVNNSILGGIKTVYFLPLTKRRI
jgi:hypothetical protein